MNHPYQWTADGDLATRDALGIAHAFHLQFDPRLAIGEAPAGYKWGRTAEVAWGLLTAGGAEVVPVARGGFLLRTAHSVAALTNVGGASPTSYLSPAGGAIWFDSGVQGGADNCQGFCGLVVGSPADGLATPTYGFYFSVGSVQITTGGFSFGATTTQNPLVGIRMGLVRWSDTVLSWYRQADPASPRLVEIWTQTVPGISGLNLHPTCQLYSKASSVKAFRALFELPST